jgi:hypothetical protein
MRSTPAKPIAIAAQRRLPTRSSLKVTPMSVRISGVACRIAVTLARSRRGERRDEQEGGQAFERGAGQGEGRPDPLELPDVARRPDDAQGDEGGEQRAHGHNLPRRQGARGDLEEGVAADERGHGQEHREDALAVRGGDEEKLREAAL